MGDLEEEELGFGNDNDVILHIAKCDKLHNYIVKVINYDESESINTNLETLNTQLIKHRDACIQKSINYNSSLLKDNYNAIM